MKQKWLIPVMVLIIIIGAVSAAFFMSRPRGNEIYASVNITAAEQSDQGVDAESIFTFESGYRLKEDQVREMIEIEPAMEYTLSGSGKKWSITPAQPLEDNMVYTIKIKNENGEVIQSFAFQTKSDLAIVSVYPANEETFVDPTSGIELTFNALGVDPADYFEIKPEVAGKFELSDYTAIFIPDEPLADNNIYRVTLKAGLTAPNGTQMKEDYTFSFETTNKEGDRWDYTQLRLAGEFSETFLPGDPIAVELSSGSDVTGQQFHIQIHQYENIDGYIKELQAYDEYYAERFGEKIDYKVDTSSLDEYASFDGELFQQGDYQYNWSSLYAILPEDLPEGHYVVTISGQDQEGNAQFVQKLIQVKNMSVYVQSVDGDSLIWVNDPVSGEAMKGVSLTLEDPNGEPVIEGVTQQDGTARLQTGKWEKAYLTVMQSGKPAYYEGVSLSEEEERPLSQKYYTALYTDREIYQPDDTIRFWGVVKPRGRTSVLPSSVYATLTTWPDNDIYRIKASVNPEDGTFEGVMPLQAISQGWYSFEITDGDEGVYTSTGFSIENYTKPPYVITVETDKDYYYANEQVNFKISANYFDGTPAAGIRLRINSSFIEAYEFTLDEKGEATYSAMLDPSSQYGTGMYSWEPQNVWYEVSNVTEEDVYTYTSGSVKMLPSRIAVKIESKSPDAATIYTAQLDASKLDQGGTVRPLIYDNEFDRLKGASVDLPLNVVVHKVEYKQIPIGSYYDYVNKRTMTRYKSERMESVVDTIQTKTTGGKVTLSDLPYQNGDNVYYWLEVQFAGGVIGDVHAVHYYFDRYSYNADNRKVYTFADTNADDYDTPVDIGEEITLGLYENNVKVENKGRVLYSAIQRKALSFGIFNESEQKVTMAEEYLPNVYFAGAYFDGRHVYTIESYNVSYEYETKRLNIDVKTDREAYRPGEKATVTISVTDQSGKPVAATACVGVVDEAVFVLAEQQVNFLEQVYAKVYYPNVRQKTSYREYNLDEASANTGGMGGGGGDGGPVREEFVDTALFQTVSVDETGKATVTFDLPDNVTSWRITTVAVTKDLQAGDSLTNTAATLPFYLRPLITSTYLEGDDIAIAVSGVGIETALGDNVDYTVTIADQSGKEIDKLTGSGKIGERIPFNFGKYDAGQYSITVRGSCGENSDAVKQDFTVVKQGITVPVIVTKPLSEVSKITPVRYPVKMMVYDERMKPFMEGIQKLSSQSGERTEIIAAAYLARVTYNELLDPEEQEKIYKDYRLETIQESENGGVKLLPVSEGDAALTAKMVVAAPELVNKGTAKEYLYSVLKEVAATPNDRVMAYVGLAALKEPVLLDISRMLENDAETLTTDQKLYLGVGLAQLGDYTSAEKIYAELGKQLVSDGDLKYVEGDGTPESRLQNTAAALMLTSITANPDADALMRFLNVQDNDRAKNYKVLCNLEMLTYVRNFTQPSGNDAAKFSYQKDGAAEEVTLDGKGYLPMTMSYEAFTNAAFKTVSGEVYACVSYTDYADQSDILPTDKVSIEKTYTPVGANSIIAPQTVKVQIKVTFSDDAPEGCYTVTDYIPSGFRYMNTYMTGYQYLNDDLWCGVQNEGQLVYGYIYRSKPEQLPEEAIVSESGKVIPATDEEIVEEDPYDPMNGGDENPNEFVLTYYVSASLAGEFITESAYVTPHTQGIAAKSERGTITVG